MSEREKPFSLFEGEPFVSFAQNGEDVMLWRALRDVGPGWYIDVGASEPEADSVTHAFYQRGWRGINIEPAPGSFERLQAARPADVNLNVAAGISNGVQTFFLVEGGNGLSTLVASQGAELRAEGWKVEQIRVPVLTLGTIIASHPHRDIHFLKIDAEGSERQVLEGADLGVNRPWIVLVEATAPNSEIETHENWESVLLDNDYRFVWFDGLNRFYVSSEKAELVDHFRKPLSIFDHYVRNSDSEAQAALSQALADLREVRAGLEEFRIAQDRFAAELASERTRADGLAAARDDAEKARDAAQGELASERTRADGLAVSLGREETARRALEIEHEEEIDDLTFERDAWMQDLFEASRYTAHLTATRQALTEQLVQERQALAEQLAQERHQVSLEKANGIQKENEAHALTVSLNDLTRKLDSMTAHRVELEHRLSAVYSSTSWRFALPVRILGRSLRRN